MIKEIVQKNEIQIKINSQNSAKYKSSCPCVNINKASKITKNDKIFKLIQFRDNGKAYEETIKTRREIYISPRVDSKINKKLRVIINGRINKNVNVINVELGGTVRYKKVKNHSDLKIRLTNKLLWILMTILR